jgi:hypothetical protein
MSSYPQAEPLPARMRQLLTHPILHPTMITPAPTRRRSADHVAFSPGDYLTDGRQLLRVVSRFDPRLEHRFAVLEDCMTLELDTYSPEQLCEMELRTVRRDCEGVQP